MNHGTAIVQRPETREDRDAIARFLAERGATPCPPQPAAIMGEWRPGPWREAERRAEQRGGTALRKQQRALKQRYPVKAIPRAAEPDHPAFVTVTRALVDARRRRHDKYLQPSGNIATGAGDCRKILSDFVLADLGIAHHPR